MKRSIYTLLIATAIFFVGCEPEEDINPFDGAIELTGNQETDIILEDINEGSGDDYYITGKWNLLANVTVLPGVNIRMEPEASIWVTTDGSFNAQGIETLPVKIYGKQRSKGYWNEITFDDSNNPLNKLRYVHVSDGGGGYQNGLVSVKGTSQVEISHTRLENSNKHGLYVSGDEERLPGFMYNVIADCKESPILLNANHLHYLDITTTFADNGNNDYIEVDAGDVINDVTWKKLTVPVNFVSYYINIFADVTVEAGATMIMGPETKIAVEPEGSLNMTGTPTERITVTAKVNAPGYFEGIVYDDSNNPLNEWHYVDFSYGGAGYYEANLGIVGSTQLKAGNCSFNYSSKYGIYVSRYSTFTDLGNNTFTGNAADDIFFQQ